MAERSATPPVGSPGSKINLNRQVLDDALKPLQKYWIDLADLNIDPGAQQGEGGYGVVRRADLTTPSGTMKVAVKHLRTDKGESQPLRVAYRLAREMIVWCKWDHPNILKFVGYHLSDDLEKAYLIAPLVTQGNVKDYLAKVQAGPDERMQLIRDTLEGLRYLHTLDRPVVHGDLKSANVLVNDGRHAVLCDFGLSTVMDSAPHGGQSPLATSTVSNFHGSFRWCSPEVVLGGTRTLPSDIWGWACLVLEIVTDNYPFPEANTDLVALGHIVQNKSPEPPTPWGPPFVEVFELLKKCWRIKPEERPTVEKCIAELPPPPRPPTPPTPPAPPAPLAPLAPLGPFREWENAQWLDETLMGYVTSIEQAISRCVEEAEQDDTAARVLMGVSHMNRAQMKHAAKEAETATQDTSLSKVAQSYMGLKHDTLSDALRGLSLSGKPASDGVPVSQLMAPPDSRSSGHKDPVWEMLRITPFFHSPIEETRDHVGDLLRELCRNLKEFAASQKDGYLTSLARGLDRLSRNYPQDFHPDVADFLIYDFYDFHIRRGNYDLAQESAEEAVERYRELASDDDQYLPRLAFSLDKISESWHLMGRDDLGLPRTEECVKVYAELAKDRPQDFLPSYGRVLVKYRTCLCRVEKGLEPKAISALETAADVYRDLVWRRNGRQQFGGDLADVLRDLDLLYSRLDRQVDVIKAKDELIQLLKALGETDEVADLEKERNELLQPNGAPPVSSLSN